ncbi:GAP family protein, partial [Mycobacterium sp. 1482292.6]|uniref:GAP family protein n=1 Tax=Mycobacterium sp. 1482292.6 TaxID=1834081 RepID=UPI000A43898A
GVLFIVAIIAASGASVSAQAGASVAFVILMYAVVEIILVGYLVRPARTQSLLLVLHDWVRSYHRQILVGLFAVVGVSELAQGLHIL